MSMKRPNVRPDADDPGLGGVPEQGLRDQNALRWVLNYARGFEWRPDGAGGPNKCFTCGAYSSRGHTEKCAAFKNFTTAAAALERPRPAPPAPEPSRHNQRMEFLTRMARVLEKLRDSGRLMPPLDPIAADLMDAFDAGAALPTAEHARPISDQPRCGDGDCPRCFPAAHAPPDLEALRSRIIRASFEIVTKSRLVETDRKWCGEQFVGSVYGVRPDDWKAFHAELDEIVEALRGSRPALAGSPVNSTEFPLRDAIDIVRLLIWREPENNAIGVRPGAALEAHALERVLRVFDGDRAQWYTTCDGCGQYLLCRILTPTLDGTPTYNLCPTCIHNAARHQELPGRVSGTQGGTKP